MVLKELFVKLGLDVDEAAFAKGQLAAGLVEAGLRKVVEIAGEVVHAFAENIKEAIEYGNRIEKTAQSIGIATGALQELQYAGKLADLSAEGMSQSIGILSRKMLEAKNGGAEAAKAFKGIAFQEGGKLKATDEVLASIADKFEKMPDGAEKTAMAMQLFGRAGKQMIPLLNKGSGELAAMRKEAQDLGLVMSEKATKASEQLNDNLVRLKAVTEGIWRQAIQPMLPAINDLVKRFLAWRKENAKLLAQKLTTFIDMIIWGFNRLADVLDLVTAGFKYLSVFMPLIAGGLAAITVAIIFLKREAIAAALATIWAWGPAALIFAGIAAAVGALLLIMEDFKVYNSGKGRSLFGEFAKSWDKLLKIDPSDGPLMRFLKEMLQMLGKAEEIIDNIGFFFEGSQYTENKWKRKHPEQFNEQGNYVGRQDQTYENGNLVMLKRGEMRMGGNVKKNDKTGEMDFSGGEVVRKEGSLTGQLDAGKYGIEARPGGEPEARMRSTGGETHNKVDVNAPVMIQAHQREGENQEDFTQRIAAIAGRVIQRHVSNAVSDGKR